MKYLFLQYIAFSFAVFSACAVASPVTIVLPAESIVLRPSNLPGYVVAQQKCGICHSADYIEYQPPGFNQQQWMGLARKMKESYGAPLSEGEVEVVGEYLASAYSGNLSAENKPANKAIEVVSNAKDNLKAVDVNVLLDNNACLGCHAIDRKVVGPAYHDVAAFYKGNAQAVSQVIEHISRGGSGRWGAIPMPPFPGLQPAELETLANFVLAQ